MKNNPFVITQNDLKMHIFPGKYRYGDQDQQTTVSLSVDEWGEPLFFDSKQLSTIHDLLTTFWFAIDKVEALWDSEFVKIFLQPQDQIETIDGERTQPKKDPIKIVWEPGNSELNLDLLSQAIDRLAESWIGTPILGVEYNGSEERYEQFRKAIRVTIMKLLQPDS